MKTIQTISNADFNYLEQLILDRLYMVSKRPSPFEASAKNSVERRTSKHNKRDKNEQKRNNPDRLESTDKEPKIDSKKIKAPVKLTEENSISKSCFLSQQIYFLLTSLLVPEIKIKDLLLYVERRFWSHNYYKVFHQF